VAFCKVIVSVFYSRFGLGFLLDHALSEASASSKNRYEQRKHEKNQQKIFVKKEFQEIFCVETQLKKTDILLDLELRVVFPTWSVVVSYIFCIKSLRFYFFERKR